MARCPPQGPGVVFGPHVRGFNYDGLAVTPIPKVSFFAYGTLSYGVNVDAGRVDGDAFEEILTGPGSSGAFGAQLRGFDFDAASVTPVPGLNAILFGTDRYGLNVATGSLDADGFAEILVGPGPASSATSRVRGHDVDGGTATPMPGTDFLAFGGLSYGVDVGVLE